MLFALAGYIVGKCKLLTGTQARSLSVLSVYIFLPCYILKNFTKNFTAEYISTRYPLILQSLAILLVIVLMAECLARVFTKESFLRRVFSYSMTVPNYGYMGYALAAPFLGDHMVTDMLVFCLPISLYTYTVGLSQLTKQKLNLKRLLNPTIIATVVGITLGLTQIQLPLVFTNVISQSASCIGPTGMILLGITLSEYDPKMMLLDWRVYVVTALRLVVIPVVMFFGARAFFGETAALMACFIYALPCGLNTVVFPKLVGENCSVGASLAFVSNILACITIPLVMSLAGI